jgi:hypothetical protein
MRGSRKRREGEKKGGTTYGLWLYPKLLTVKFLKPQSAWCEYIFLFLFWWYWGLNSGPTPWATPSALLCVCDGFFWDRVSRTIYPGWLRILLISAPPPPPLPKITGMSHWCWQSRYCFKLVKWLHFSLVCLTYGAEAAHTLTGQKWQWGMTPLGTCRIMEDHKVPLTSGLEF